MFFLSVILFSFQISEAMIRVRQLAGKEVACLEMEELQCLSEHHGVGHVRALKLHLQTLCAVPRFRQRLLQEDGQILSDDALLGAPMSLQLVLLGFSETTYEQVQTFCRAVGGDDLRQVETFLQRPQDPNLAADGATALHFASEVGNKLAAALLLEARADVHRARTDGATPLCLAAVNGHLEVARLFLEAGAKDGPHGAMEVTPLFVAAHCGHLDVARLLLESGADSNEILSNGYTALLTAAHNGHLEVARLLLTCGADRDRALPTGETPLYLAEQYGHLDVAALLRDYCETRAKRRRQGQITTNT